VTDIEQRLRRDLQEVTERVAPGSIRPLRAPAPRRGNLAVRWLAPVAAMAAVLGVVAGVSLVGRGSSELPASATSPEPAGTMPRYYVNVYQNDAGPLPLDTATLAVVHDSATGAILTTVRVPTLSGWHGATEGPRITAAGDDRTFVITETAERAAGPVATNRPPSAFKDVTRFYRLRVAADGRSASLSPLPVSIGGLTVDDVALSADGGRLAVAAQSCQSSDRCAFTGIRVITLATGAAVDWAAPVPGAAWNLSWAGDDYLAFQWQGQTGRDEERLLDVAGTAGGNLLAAPQIAPAATAPAPASTPTPETGSPGPIVMYGYGMPALITADGKAVVTTAIQGMSGGQRLGTVTEKIVELSAATGKLLKVLYTTTGHHVLTGPGGYPGCSVVSLGPTGVQPLVGCSPAGGRFTFGKYFTLGRVENGELTPLPGSTSATWAAAPGQGSVAW
jgi:hypothetical protein